VTQAIQIGTRVYLANCVAGEPGCVVAFDRWGKAEVHWPDMPELGRNTHHRIETLVVDEAFKVQPLDFGWGERAA
jgi:hypothetical protein